MTLYLKYRPSSFESLVGQDFISNTLSNAIMKDKLVGAYLFCGPRGTGKTSTARIFAKSINCLNLKSGNPCLECEVCKGFENESLVDIIEIDAASHTGVDNIRDIIERAKFTPTHLKYKVYIVDEVHMLSKGAFNALLKILEEPPAHLKFILATTEIQKIPETILSRCQRYDFKSINKNDLRDRLIYISKKEGISIDEKSLDFIVKQSSGGLRNAISLFEQLIFDQKIYYDYIINNYGIPEDETLEKFYKMLFEKDSSVLGFFEEITNKYSLIDFFKELLFLTRDKLIENITDKDRTKNNLFILENIEKSLLNSKHSFDQKTTFLVGIVKIISGINEQNNTQAINQPIKSNLGNTTKIKKEEVDIKQQEINNNEELTPDDLFDVFGDDDFGNKKEEVNTKEVDNSFQVEEKTKKTNNSSSGFDKELFLQNLKTLGAKGALTMSLRSSSFSLGNNNLTIQTKTKIAFNQISQSDNLGLMNKSLEKMGLLDIQITTK